MNRFRIDFTKLAHAYARQINDYFRHQDLLLSHESNHFYNVNNNNNLNYISRS